MSFKKFIIITFSSLAVLVGPLSAAQKQSIGVVNFATCMTESKYGQQEQEQFQKIQGQWNTLIQDTDKEIQAINEKLNDEDYMDGISPDAKTEMLSKKQTLEEDMLKYRNQSMQIMQQAQYFFVQKVYANISKAAEEVAKKQNVKMVMNKEVFFYTSPDMDLTDKVISEMNTNFEEEVAQAKLKEKEADKEIATTETEEATKE